MWSQFVCQRIIFQSALQPSACINQFVIGYLSAPLSSGAELLRKEEKQTSILLDLLDPRHRVHLNTSLEQLCFCLSSFWFFISHWASFFCLFFLHISPLSPVFLLQLVDYFSRSSDRGRNNPSLACLSFKKNKQFFKHSVHHQQGLVFFLPGKNISLFSDVS